MTKAFGTLRPAKLQVGDKVRLVSPASPPNPADVLQGRSDFVRVVDRQCAVIAALVAAYVWLDRRLSYQGALEFT